MLHADLALSQRLEATEARCNTSFVEARAQLHPASGATWQRVGGTTVLFDTPASPLTQTFGLGLFAEVTAAELAQIEAFFAQRHAPVLHEVSPLAPATLPLLLAARGYQPIEYTNVLFRDLTSLPTPPPNAAVSTRIIAPAEADHGARTAAGGWLPEAPELEVFLREMGQLTARSVGMVPFVAEIEGQAVATGSLFLGEGVALLAGASTVPAGRRQGAQTALLAARLHYAVAQGCTLATMAAHPGSQSQRNAERHGFRVAYTRTKWQLMAG